MKRETFLKFAEAIRAQMEREEAPPKNLQEAIEMIEERGVDWLRICHDEKEKPAIVAANLATLVAVALRAAEALYAKLPDQVIEKAILEHQPEKVRACRVCGCTEDQACPGGCSWVGPDLCSACGDPASVVSEKIYDTELAPKLWEIGKRCEELKFSFVATVEFAPGQIGRTKAIQPNAHYQQLLVFWAAECGGNVDVLIHAIDKYAQKHGHSSIYLTQLDNKNVRYTGNEFAAFRVITPNP